LKVATNFSTLHVFGVPLGDDPVEISPRSFVSEKQSPSAIVQWYLCDNTFSHSDTTRTCDRCTNGEAGLRATAYTMLAYHHSIKTNICYVDNHKPRN